MSSSKLSIQLYRVLFRLTKKFDNHPISKALIYRKKFLNKDDQTIDTIYSNNLPHSDKSYNYYNKIINNVFNDESRAFISPSNFNTEKYSSILRKEFYDSKNSNKIDNNDRIEVAFKFIRKLSKIWNDYVNISDGRSFNDDTYIKDHEKFVKPEILMSKSLFPGVLLVAHPLLPGSLHRSVILLVEHNQNGSYGIIINRATNHTLSTGINNLPEQFKSLFGKHILFFGGKERRLQCLHNQPLCAGIPIPLCDQPLLAGGNLPDLMKYYDNNNNDNNFISFYAGCCYWNKNDLEKEIEMGYWIPVISQPDKYVKLSYRFAMEEYNQFNDGFDDNFDDDVSYNHSDDEIKKSNKLETLTEDSRNDIKLGFSSDSNNNDIDDLPNIWNVILNDLDLIYKDISRLPEYADITSIESIDWK